MRQGTSPVSGDRPGGAAAEMAVLLYSCAIPLCPIFSTLVTPNCEVSTRLTD